MTSATPTVRVRFAPAPSGSLHVGNARTALFNWAFARHHSGRFVLRIEDTDATRATEAAMHELMDVLRWLGLDWDEGPDAGGPYAPYRQSERSEVYKLALDQLLSDGAAYPCYCTPEELDLRRKDALAAGRPPGYDRRCLNLSEAERHAFEAGGRPFAVRFRVPEGSTTFTDAVRGEITFEHAQIFDFVIARSDGSPTYLLAAGHDDMAMDITHIIRGEDLLSATPRQMLLYRALGHERVPVFAHLPLLVGADRQPLSKRHGDVSVETYRAQGFLPEAMINYLALLGWSFGDGTTERFTREELVEHFSLEGVSKNPAAFDVAKLTALNGEYVRGLVPEELARRLEPFLAELAPSDEMLAMVVPLIQERMARLDEAEPMVRFFFVDPRIDPAAAAKFLTPEWVPALSRYEAELRALPDWEAPAIEAAMRRVQEELELKKKTAFMPVRVAVTGSLVSPPLFESLAVLGRERSLEALEAGIAWAKAGG